MEHKEHEHPSHAREEHLDVVCGYDLTDIVDGVKAEHEGRTYHFCGEGCLSRFQDEPEKFFGEPLVRLRNVTKGFMFASGETRVLQDIDLNIWAGDFMAIVGASGSGKSTLLNMIGLLDHPTGGSLHIAGRDAGHMSDEERAVLRSDTFGFVFQQYNLIPWLTAYDNITLPLIFSRKPLDVGEFDRQLEKVGIAARMHHRPMQLSGGEQQRVALMRSLVNNPKVIIGDEPTGNLDSQTGHRILDMLIALHKEQGKTLIIVTHDHSIAEEAEEVITLKDGVIVRDGRIHKKYIHTTHHHND